MQHYEGVPVVQLGDAAGGYRSTDGRLAPNFTTWGTVDILPDWVDGFEGVTPETLSFEQLYIAAARVPR
jgi:hypothetical protein